MKRFLIFGGAGSFLLWILLSIAKPMDTRTARGAAVKTLDNLVKECLYKKVIKEPNPKFLLPILANYKFTPINGNCDGDEYNLIRANSDDLSKYPSFSYDVITNVKTCFHDGPIKKLYGCSARRNGEW
ncbi:hypothetical protein [Prochlorococcus marinus]|uniref:Uncharacterized protein n=1 Tax=Prochlorococcus marinus (strain MIT 9211) TaxID=93059 RepID=A9BEL5_PROM4|nr:hypothetical protein [Prochlorococcus marinus]ABX08525.1 Hypothetical protein P9211_05941 [Prochlorococcus marinus str. MIT 9211]